MSWQCVVSVSMEAYDHQILIVVGSKDMQKMGSDADKDPQWQVVSFGRGIEDQVCVEWHFVGVELVSSSWIAIFLTVQV